MSEVSIMTMGKAMDAFIDWASVSCINLDDEKDWKPWWNCWYNGYNVGTGKGYNNALLYASAAIEELKQR